MKILTYRSAQGLQLGVQTDRGVLDVCSALLALRDDWRGQDFPTSPDDFIKAGLPALQELQNFFQWLGSSTDQENCYLDESKLTLGPCVPHPGKILCVGLNYRRHATESDLPIPETPLLFSKLNNAIAAAEEDVPLPSRAKECDYEAELVIVIGKQAKNIPKDEALNYVLGYCNGNDLSARDLQMLTSQWLLGKSLDKFMPIGPYLVTADEINDPQNLEVRCWLNDELRQDSNSSDMIFSIPEVISYTSQFITLMPGDIISTGTPEGVILGMKEKKWLVPNDTVSVEVSGLGRLTNRMVEEVSK